MGILSTGISTINYERYNALNLAYIIDDLNVQYNEARYVLYADSSMVSATNSNVVLGMPIVSLTSMPYFVNKNQTFEMYLKLVRDSVALVPFNKETGLIEDYFYSSTDNTTDIDPILNELLSIEYNVSLPVAGLEVKPEANQKLKINRSTRWSVRPEKDGDFTISSKIEPSNTKYTLSPIDEPPVNLEVSSPVSLNQILVFIGGIVGALFAGLPAWFNLRDRRRLEKLAAEQSSG